MEILTDLIRSWFGPDKMSDQAVFITAAMGCPLPIALAKTATSGSTP